MNVAEAIRYYKLAADQGYAIAQRNYALMLLGRWDTTSEHEAMEYMRRAAEQDDPDAACDMGVAYAHGKHVPKSDERAIEYLSKPARSGHARAQAELASVLARQPAPDWKRVLQLYVEAAQQGHARAAKKVGVCYSKGLGVERNPAMALKLFVRAAEQHNNMACAFAAAKMYFKHNYGDPSTAICMLHLAQRHHYPKAALLLARLHFTGHGTLVSCDPALAQCILKQSFDEFDNVRAGLELARFHERSKNRVAMRQICTQLPRSLPYVEERLLAEVELVKLC